MGLDGERTGHRAPLTDDPLDPDDIVGVGLGAEVLEAAAEVVAHPPALLPQVALGLGEEVLRHVHHVHRLEEGQQQPLGDAADARPAVQSAGRPRPVGAVLERKPRGAELPGEATAQEQLRGKSPAPRRDKKRALGAPLPVLPTRRNRCRNFLELLMSMLEMWP